MARLGKKDNEQIIKELLIENKILEKENERLRTRCEQARDEGTGYMQQLEHENAELKEINEGYNRNRDKLIAMGFPTFKSCKEYSDKLTNLQKENTTLKKQVEQKQHLADVRLEQSLENYKLFSDERKERIDIDIALEDMTDNLTKAKEIIKDLLTLPFANNWEVYADVTSHLDRAEQFLKLIGGEENEKV